MNKTKVFKLAKGFRGRAKNCIRIARERVEKSLQYAFRDRRTKVGWMVLVGCCPSLGAWRRRRRRRRHRRHRLMLIPCYRSTMPLCRSGTCGPCGSRASLQAAASTG